MDHKFRPKAPFAKGMKPVDPPSIASKSSTRMTTLFGCSWAFRYVAIWYFTFPLKEGASFLKSSFVVPHQDCPIDFTSFLACLHRREKSNPTPNYYDSTNFMDPLLIFWKGWIKSGGGSGTSIYAYHRGISLRGIKGVEGERIGCQGSFAFAEESDKRSMWEWQREKRKVIKPLIPVVSPFLSFFHVQIGGPYLPVFPLWTKSRWKGW